ncbi:MAG: hypothetical protein GXX10_03280 [Clostridiaceae bacterium]|nr:hypothetical protein [Clostridiaceae bacterium]
MLSNLSGFFAKKNEDGKKKPSPFETIIIFIILGVMIVLAGSYLAKPDDAMETGKTSGISTSGTQSASNSPIDGYELITDLEKRLSELLSKVEGAGAVSVMIYADSSSEQVPAYNNVQDTRNDERETGRSSEISETREVALSGNENPVILKVLVPQIRGVVVVAEGADDILIKEQLNKAVCTLLGIPEHRVHVLKHK